MKKYLIENKEYTLEELIKTIVDFNNEIYAFWEENSLGWAPTLVSNLLSKSRLDWQKSLTNKLNYWNKTFLDIEYAELIFAWVNLGCLVEGTIKLALSVFKEDYLKSSDKIIRGKKISSPDEIELDRLRIFSNGKLWDKSSKWNDWILHIQQRRNAIHAFKDRDLGSFSEFYEDLAKYLEFLIMINVLLPYPDVTLYPTIK